MQAGAPPAPRRYGLELFWSVITSAPGRLPTEVVNMAQVAFVEVFKSKYFPTEVRALAPPPSHPFPKCRIVSVPLHRVGSPLRQILPILSSL